MKKLIGKHERKIISYLLREIKRGHLLRINGLPLLWTSGLEKKYKIKFFRGDYDYYFHVMDMRTNTTMLFIPLKDIKEISVNYKNIIIL